MGFIALVGVWLALVQATGACPMCASGGPADYVKFEDSEDVVMTPGKLRRWSVTLDTRTVESSEGDEVEESHGQTQLGFSAGYRPNAKLLLLARVPYVRATLREDNEEHVNSGIGDAEIMAAFEFKRGAANWWPALTAVVKLPTGDNDVQADDSDAEFTRLEEHGQIGTGAADAMLMGHLRHAGVYRVAATLGYRFNGQNDFEYQYGSVAWLDVDANRSVYGSLWAGGVLRVRNSDRHLDNGENVEDSGGTILLLMPEAGVSIGSNLNLFVQGIVPVINHLNGTQEEKVGFSVALTQSF